MSQNFGNQKFSICCLNGGFVNSQWAVFCDTDCHSCVAERTTFTPSSSSPLSPPLPPPPLPLFLLFFPLLLFPRPAACAVEDMATPSPVGCPSFTQTSQQRRPTKESTQSCTCRPQGGRGQGGWGKVGGWGGRHTSRWRVQQ